MDENLGRYGLREDAYTDERKLSVKHPDIGITLFFLDLS